MKACESLNAQCFPKYGHTVLMLNNLFNKSVSLGEYNSFVFNKNTLVDLLPYIDSKTKTHFNSFAPFLKKCQRAQADSVIFTNAHHTWIDFFVKELSEDQVFQDMPVVYPSKLAELKPRKRAYNKVETTYPKADTFWFVDDSSGNLTEPSLRPHWVPFHYTANTQILDMQEHFGLV